MEFHTAVVDRIMHLMLFLAGAATLVVTGLAIVERTVERGKSSIRPLHIVIPLAVFVGVGLAERLYHALA